MERKYNFLEKLMATWAHQSPEYYYATNVEKLLMEFDGLQDYEKKEFLRLIENKNK